MTNAQVLTSSSDIITRTRWYIYIRWYLLAAIALPGVVSLYIVDGFSQQVYRDALLGIIAILSNGIFYGVSRIIKKQSSFKKLAVSLITTDIFLVSGIIFINGGIESRNAILYVLPILLTAAIFGRKAIYKTTLATIIAYDSLILLDYFNVIHSVGAFDPSLRSWFSYVINTVAFFTAVLIIVGVVTDFITRLMAEKERQAYENLAALKQAQSIAQFGSWEWDIKNDKVYWSEELRRIFGVKSNTGEVDYEHYIKTLHPDDREMAHEAINNGLKKRKIFSFDHRIVRPNGTIRYLHGVGQPIIDENGKVIKLIGNAQDVTEAKSLEEARNDFVALASHQLRTPATGVKQYLGLLLEGYAGSLSEDQNSFVKIAYDSNDRQLSIVDDLLNVAQVDSRNLKLRKDPVDLVALLKSITQDEALKFANKEQTLSLSVKHKKLVCDIDERRIRMVVENILDNAHKYTAKNGKIDLELTKKGKNALIIISDNGLGIAKKDIVNIFKKFARVNNPETRLQEGTGLGLYIAKRIVTLHGGDIKVESNLNKGTKFKIYLPIKARSKITKMIDK